MSTLEIRRSYYEDGTLRFEAEFIGEIPNGRQRRWHPNGELAYEGACRNGVNDGICRQWNSKGELLGEYNIIDGTGVERSWSENGQLTSEITLVNSQMTGRFRCWADDGELLVTHFYLRNSKVSKKRYEQECESDPLLPRYTDDNAKSAMEKAIAFGLKAARKKKTSAKTEALVEDEHAEIASPDSNLWFSKTDKNCERTIGESRDQAESQLFVQEFIDLGVKRVRIVNIDTYPDGSENANSLILELPKDKRKRSKIFKRVNELISEQGFEAERDRGQPSILLGID